MITRIYTIIITDREEDLLTQKKVAPLPDRSIPSISSEEPEITIRFVDKPYEGLHERRQL